ncbi:MAG: HK97 gp10 family phage protein [Selenomonadaceae bacterium]|nr:HK97 gp10 family phage protein [Selenomonadaceae bacterium]
MIGISEISGYQGTGANVRFTNLDEFMQKINEVARDYPKTSEKYLRILGNRLRKAVINKTPDGATSGSYDIKDEHGNTIKTKKSKIKLKNTWAGKVVGARGEDLEYQLRSKSKRYHLVERGHYLVFMGKKTGRDVEGRWFFKKAVNEFKTSDQVNRVMEQFMNMIKKRIEANA